RLSYKRKIREPPILIKHLPEQWNQQLATTLTQMIIIIINWQPINITPTPTITAKVGQWIQDFNTTLRSSTILRSPGNLMTLMILFETDGNTHRVTPQC